MFLWLFVISRNFFLSIVFHFVLVTTRNLILHKSFFYNLSALHSEELSACSSSVIIIKHRTKLKIPCQTPSGDASTTATAILAGCRLIWKMKNGVESNIMWCMCTAPHLVRCSSFFCIDPNPFPFPGWSMQSSGAACTSVLWTLWWWGCCRVTRIRCVGPKIPPIRLPYCILHIRLLMEVCYMVSRLPDSIVLSFALGTVLAACVLGNLLICMLPNEPNQDWRYQAIDLLCEAGSSRVCFTFATGKMGMDIFYKWTKQMISAFCDQCYLKESDE